MYIVTDDIRYFVSKIVDEIVEIPDTTDKLRVFYGILIGKIYALYDLLNEEKD